jgi:hypothetical protein
MAVIREYERQFGAQGADPGRRASIEDFGSVSHGLADLSHGLGAASSMILQYEENREISDAQIKMSEMDAQFDERRQQLYADAKPGVSTAKQIKEELTNNLSVMEGNYKSNRARQYVKVHGARLTSANVQDAARFDLDLGVKTTFQNMGKIFDFAAKKDPKDYAETKAAIEFDFKNKLGVFSFKGGPLVDIALEKEFTHRIEGMAYVAGLKDIENPAVRGSIVGQVKPTAATGNLIDQVVKREGGYVSNDAGRGETNFGINTSAHPGVDIKGLTADKAKEIYKRDYWDAYGIGNLDPSVQAVVFDGVVNHGEPFKSNMVKAAKNGATAEQLGQMRLAEYQRLISANPDKYAQYEKSWTNRVNETVKTINDSGIVVEAPQLQQKPAWWDDLTAERQIQITNHAIELNRREKSVADSSLRSTIADVDAHIKLTGKVPDQLPPASAFTDPALKQKFDAMITAAQQTGIVANAPFGKQQEMLEKMKPVYGVDAPGVYDYKAMVYDHAVDQIKAYNQNRVKDKIGTAYTGKYSSGSPLVPIEKYDAENLVASLGTRFPVSEAINKDDGLPVRHLMNAEAANLNAYVNQMDSAQLTSWVDSVAEKTTDKTKLREVMRQAFPNDKAMTVAMDIALSNDVPAEKSQADTKAILFGRMVMNSSTKGAGNEQEKAFKNARLPSNSDAIKQVARYAGVLNMPEGQIESLTEAVLAHYVGTSLAKNTNQNLDLTDKDVGATNVDMFNQSIKAVMGDGRSGKVGTKAGSTTVLRPYGMDEAQFMTRVQQQVDTAFQGKYQWGEYSLVTTGSGKYEVHIAGKPPFLVDPTETTYGNEGRTVPSKVAAPVPVPSAGTVVANAGTNLDYAARQKARYNFEAPK